MTNEEKNSTYFILCIAIPARERFGLEPVSVQDFVDVTVGKRCGSAIRFCLPKKTTVNAVIVVIMARRVSELGIIL